MGFIRPNPHIGQLTESNDVHGQFRVIANHWTEQLQILALCWVSIRFIIRVRVRVSHSVILSGTAIPAP